MDMRYMRWPLNNFGDNLNDEIFSQFGITEKVDFHKSNMFNQDRWTLLGLGTLINKKIASSMTVLGSGCNGTSKPNAHLDYVFVRGKLSAKYLNLDPALGLGDPVYFLSEWIQNFAQPVIPGKVGIVPHWKTAIEGFNIISPQLPVKDFIQELSSCEYVFAEAMHGAMCADILRRPFAPIKLQSNFDEFKWQDWGTTIGKKFEFGDFQNHKFYISKDKVLKKLSTTVKNALEQGIESTQIKLNSIIWC